MQKPELQSKCDSRKRDGTKLESKSEWKQFYISGTVSFMKEYVLEPDSRKYRIRTKGLAL